MMLGREGRTGRGRVEGGGGGDLSGFSLQFGETTWWSSQLKKKEEKKESAGAKADQQTNHLYRGPPFLRLRILHLRS